jgi:hypothetical protein
MLWFETLVIRKIGHRATDTRLASHGLAVPEPLYDKNQPSSRLLAELTEVKKP